MNKKMSALGVFVKLLGSAAVLSAPPAYAVQVTPIGEFTNFYTENVYDTTGDDLVVNRVNGQQLCAFGPAQGSQTTYDCSKDGPAGMELSPGTPRVEWQVVPINWPAWDRNVVSFQAATAQDVTLGQKFMFGRLLFENGTWSSLYTELSYNLTFTTGDAALDALYDFEYSGTLVVQGTPNLGTNTPEQNADFIYLADDPDLGSLRAYELFDSPTGSNVVSVELWGYLGSVHLVSFENVRGAGFIDPGIALGPTPVPEPGTLALLALGIAGLGLSRRRKAV